MSTIRRSIWVLVPLALVPAGLGARSMSEPGVRPEVAAVIPEEGSSEIGGLRVRAEFEGRLGPTLRVRLRGYNPTASQITASLRVELQETEPGDPDSRMGSEMMPRGAETVAVEVAPKGGLDRLLTFKVKGMSERRAKRLIKRGLLTIDVSEGGSETREGKIGLGTLGSIGKS